MSEFKPGDIVHLKSGGPKMVIVQSKDTISKVSWFGSSPEVLLVDQVNNEVIESQEDHIKREADYLTKTQQGLLRLPPGATDDNTVVICFQTLEQKADFWAKMSQQVPFGAQTIMGDETPKN